MENGNRNTQYRIQKDRIVRDPKASTFHMRRIGIGCILSRPRKQAKSGEFSTKHDREWTNFREMLVVGLHISETDIQGDPCR